MSDIDTLVKPNSFIHVIGRALEVLSGEYLLTFFRYPNGGTVVFLRSAHVTLVLFFVALALMNGLDPARGTEFSWNELSIQTLQHVSWMGGIFATAYALLYARFASQWTYVAGVYNQIKAAQVRKDTSAEILAEWMAGFIEDCDDLHLLRKPMFASIAHEWLKNVGETPSAVAVNLKDHAPGGAKRCSRIEAEAKSVVEFVENQYK